MTDYRRAHKIHTKYIDEHPSLANNKKKLLSSDDLLGAGRNGTTVRLNVPTNQNLFIMRKKNENYDDCDRRKNFVLGSVTKYVE